MAAAGEPSVAPPGAGAHALGLLTSSAPRPILLLFQHFPVCPVGTCNSVAGAG